jgi:hypothetical protein
MRLRQEVAALRVMSTEPSAFPRSKVRRSKQCVGLYFCVGAKRIGGPIHEMRSWLPSFVHLGAHWLRLGLREHLPYKGLKLIVFQVSHPTDQYAVLVDEEESGPSFNVVELVSRPGP